MHSSGLRPRLRRLHSFYTLGVTEKPCLLQEKIMNLSSGYTFYTFSEQVLSCFVEVQCSCFKAQYTPPRKTQGGRVEFSVESVTQPTLRVILACLSQIFATSRLHQERRNSVTVCNRAVCDGVGACDPAMLFPAESYAPVWGDPRGATDPRVHEGRFRV